MLSTGLPFDPDQNGLDFLKNYQSNFRLARSTCSKGNVTGVPSASSTGKSVVCGSLRDDAIEMLPFTHWFLKHDFCLFSAKALPIMPLFELAFDARRG